MPKEKIVLDVRDEILEFLKDRGTTLKWLSDKTEINYNTLHSCLAKKFFNLSQDSLDLINDALDTSFKL